MPVGYLKESASQTAGPFVAIGLKPSFAGLHQDAPWASNRVEGRGERILIEGIIVDGSGELIRDALVELWQADAEGRYGAAGFRGFARSTNEPESGLYRFDTIRPGATRNVNGARLAPHATLLIFARGLNIHLHTRMYFPEAEAENAADPDLARVPGTERRATLIAARAAGPGTPRYRFDIRVQGEGETVFFDI